MKPKFLIAVLVAMLAISSAAIAKPSMCSTHHKGRHPMIQRMSKELGLTPEQLSKVKAIVAKHRKEVQSVRESNLPAKQKWTEIRKIRVQEKKEISAVLTPEQRAKAKTLFKKRMLAMRGKRMQKLSAALGLTDAQKASIKGIWKNAATQCKAIRENKSLDRAAKVARIKAVRKEARQKFLSVLTPEQRAKLKTRRKERCRR